MTDPSVGLESFQKALRRGEIDIRPSFTDSTLYVHLDAPTGLPRLRYTYLRLKRKTVTAMVIFAAEPPIKGKLHFSVGYAVPKAYQNQGRGREIVLAGIADMRAGLLRNGHAEFYLDAIVAADNFASRRIAEESIAKKAKTITEEHSGLPAFKYIRKVK